MCALYLTYCFAGESVTTMTARLSTQVSSFDRCDVGASDVREYKH